MTRQILLLAPGDVKPGTVAPDGRVVKHVELHESAEKGALVMGVTYEDDTLSALMWPLGYGWTVDGRCIPAPGAEGKGG